MLTDLRVLSRATRGSGLHRVSGLTMIEVLVVTMVVAILASVIVITIDLNSDQKQIRKLAEALQIKLVLAQDESLFLGDLIGIEVFENGYRFLQWYSPPTAVESIAAVQQGALSELSESSLSESSITGDSPGTTGSNSSQSGVILADEFDEPQPLQYGYWQPIDTDPMRSTTWLPESIRIALDMSGAEIELPSLLDPEEEAEALAKLDFAKPEDNPFVPLLIFLPSGETSEYTLTLYLQDNPELDHRLEGDMLGRIKLIRPGQAESDALDEFDR